MNLREQIYLVRIWATLNHAIETRLYRIYETITWIKSKANQEVKIKCNKLKYWKSDIC